MKTFSFLFLALFFTSKIFGQGFNSFEKYRRKVENQIHTSSNKSKTRSVKQRLIVDSTYSKDNNNFEFLFAVHYFYANERGSTQSNDGNYIRIDCQSDSNFIYSSYADVEKAVNKYDNNNNLMEYVYSGYSAILQEFVPKFKGAFSYTVFNKINASEYFKYTINTWIPTSNNYYTYNADNKVEKILQTVYDGPNLDSTSKFEYEYVANQLASSKEYTFKNATWEIKNHNTYNYNLQNKITTQNTFSNWTGNILKDTTVLTYIYDSLNRLDSLINSVWSNNDTMYYNSFHKNSYVGNDSNVASIKAYNNNGVAVSNVYYTYDITKNLSVAKWFQYFQVDSFTQYDTYHYEDYYPSKLNEQQSLNSNLMLYPNPANSSVNVLCESKLSQEAEIKLLDMTGKVLYTSRQKYKLGMNTFSVPLAAISKGIYFIAISTNDQKTKYEKLIKE